jgi:hypothetical protein
MSALSFDRFGRYGLCRPRDALVNASRPEGQLPGFSALIEPLLPPDVGIGPLSGRLAQRSTLSQAIGGDGLTVR